MKTSPFKVMTTAALATAIAVPAAATTADAAEVSIEKIAFSLDGEVQVVDYQDYVDAIISESGDLYEYTEEATVAAIGVGDGVYVDYEALVTAILDADEDKTAKEVLGEQAENEEALVDEDTVAEYTEYGEETAPEVTAVEATNLKQVEVSLSGNYDAEAAADVDNYSLSDDVELSSVWVNEGTVTLNLSSAVSNQTTLDLTVDEDVAGSEVTSEVEFFDTTIPEVTGAEVVGQDTIKVKFSEPIDAYDANGNLKSSVKDAFEVNDGELFVSNVTPLKNNTEFNVELYSSLEDGSVDLTVLNKLEDYAGFNVVSDSLELDVVEDNEAPAVVDYKNATPNSVTLVFNEDVQFADDVTYEDFYHTNSSNTVLSGTDSNGNPLGYTLDGNELTLNFGEGSELPEGTAYVYVDGETVVDLWGNVNDNQLRTQVDVEIDEVNPTLDDITVDAEDKVTLTFSEKLDADSVSEGDFTLLGSDGEEADLIQDVKASEDEVVVEFKEKLSGDYALVVEDLTDLSGNEIDKVSKAFNVDDLTKPVIDGSTTPVTGDGFTSTLYNADEDVQTLVVNFGEKMATDGKYSVLDLEKYVISGGNLSSSVELADVSGATINAVDNASKVEIKLPYDSSDSSTIDLQKDSNWSYDLQIARVADASGNATVKLADTIQVADEGFVGISSATAVDTETIEVAFDDRLVDFESSDLSIEDSSGDLEVASRTISLNDSGNTVVTFKLDDALNTNATTANGAVTVEVDGTDSTNKYGETLDASDSESVVDGIQADLDATVTDGADADGMVEATTNGSTMSFDLQFTEDVQGSEATYGTFFTVGDFTFNPSATATTDLSDGEYMIEENGTDAVTVTVYTNTSDDFDVDYTENKYFTDQANTPNKVDDFSVTVDVYDE